MSVHYRWRYAWMVVLCCRFTVVVTRENYPLDQPPPLAPPMSSVWLQPAHTVTLLNALTLVNLLPYELNYFIKDIVSSRIQPGHEAAIHQVTCYMWLLKVFNGIPWWKSTSERKFIIHAYCGLVQVGQYLAQYSRTQASLRFCSMYKRLRLLIYACC